MGLTQVPLVIYYIVTRTSKDRGWYLNVLVLCTIGIGILIKLTCVAGHLRLYWETNPQSWTNLSAEETPGGCRWTPEDYRKSIDFMIPDRRELQRMHIYYML